MTKSYYIKTLLGYMKIIVDNKYITNVKIIDEYEFKNDRSNDKIYNDINNYLTHKSKRLISKIAPNGTYFQMKVWSAISGIKYGKTKTYGEIAKMIGHPKAYRAVANACKQNKLPFFIPCHRVVSAKDIGGYVYGMTMKRELLALES